MKDLRELICVSRLTIRDSDQEDELSFSDDDGRLSRALEELGLHNADTDEQITTIAYRGNSYFGIYSRHLLLKCLFIFLS